MKGKSNSIKKIGILTDYNGNTNYGGVLQAYALQKIISSFGYGCEQIQYKFIISQKQKIQKSLYYFCARSFDEKIDLIKLWIKNGFKINKKKRVECDEIVQERNKKILLFSEGIPHTKTIYYSNTISSINGKYDAFVVGSDIIWLPERVLFQNDKVFFLDFVRNGRKIAYAASTGVSKLPHRFEKEVRRDLAGFDRLSVREKSMASKIERLSEKEVASVLDPTMLISSKDWLDLFEIQEKNEEYIFCYFLGRDKKSRLISRKISEKKGQRLKVLRYANGRYCDVDDGFEADYVDTIDPREFVETVLNSSLVITDSFHGIAMSIVMGKEFLAIEREKESRVSFNSRINDILATFDLRDRKIHDLDEAIKVLEKPIDYQDLESRLVELREYSLDWLKNSLE
ncbi:MAG: polysaccharide pyruvyl transferase family protein [Butyrivibrio sp.]|nr:polysaccharide pyruvyl transferase family protein [Butyrivibrio sp.]